MRTDRQILKARVKANQQRKTLVALAKKGNTSAKQVLKNYGKGWDQTKHLDPYVERDE